jgi:hypothetical protein
MPAWLIVVNLLLLILYAVAWMLRDPKPDPYDVAERALDPRRMPPPRKGCGGCGGPRLKPVYGSRDELLADVEKAGAKVAVFVDDAAVRPGGAPPLRYGTLASGQLARLA